MKCKIVNGKKICRETNPLKMWGSWIGAVIGLISIILIYGGVNNILIWRWLFPSTTSGGLCNIFPSICGGDIVGYAIASIFIGFPLQIILGFFLGYVLTLIWRKIRK